jgi:hypothetical protein
LLLHEDGGIGVIDPLRRWAVPAQEDLCRLLVGMRLVGLQVHTRGLAIDRDRLDRLQAAAIRGYYGGDVPWAVLRCYEALLLLDKWSALVSRNQGPGRRTKVLAGSLRLASRYISAEVGRVLDAGEAGRP